MDDFEYSVEIGDRDWAGFFAECEECNLLPPSLAGVDDSGMSDVDDQGFISNLSQNFSENQQIRKNPDRDGSPVCLGRLDSVLSGSEEDLHLQSVNMFFERLKSLTEAEPSPQRAGNDREAIKEEDLCGSGHQPNRSNLPENFSKTSTLPARGEPAAGQEAVKSVNTTRSINPEEKITFESAASANLVPKTHKAAEKEFRMREKTFGEAQLNKFTKSTTFSDLIDKTLTSETTQEIFRVEPSKNVESIKLDQNVLRNKSFINNANEEQSPSQESSPSCSIRRKRKKKKRLSVDASEGGPVWERQVSAKQSDSEGEQCAARERTSGMSSKDSQHLNEPQNNPSVLPTTCEINNWSLNGSEDEIRKHKSDFSLNQTNDTQMLTVLNSAHKATSSHACRETVVEKTELNKNENTRLENVNFSDANFECEQIQNNSTTKLKSADLSQCAESHALSVEVSQNDKLSAAKSVLAAETGNSGRVKHMHRQSGAEAQEQLENDAHHTNQYNHTPEKAQLCPSPMIGTNSEALNPKPNNAQSDYLSWSKDLKSSPLDITHVTSFTMDTETFSSLSYDNLTDMSASFCLSDGEQDLRGHEERNVSNMTILEEIHLEPEGNKTPESEPDFLRDAENIIDAATSVSETVKGENSVFAMSSFWKEMEKLTINDILGLRKISRASLTPVPESEEADTFAMTNLGIFTAVDESKPEEIPEKTATSSTSVTWETEPLPLSVNVYPLDTKLTPVNDTSQPLLTERNAKCFKKFPKTITVHNLKALESEPSSYMQQNEILQTIDEKESGNVRDFCDKRCPKQDTDSYSISLTDVFKYFFGGKQPVPHQPAEDNLPTVCSGGKSVPETYDEFFSEFDTESFFYSLVTSEEKKPVPIFSYSRSSGRNLEYPEAYEYFFASSSSDDSSVESDEEENHRPLRVVSRFSRKASSTKLFTDMYEDFFTERDFKENFFCLKSLSFRKTRFTGSAIRTQSLNPVSHVAGRQNSRLDLRAAANPNVLGNQDVMLPDPLLYHLEDRISRTLGQQSFRYEDLQTPTSNPGLDAPLLPFKQSDMCLVCIAFASWVLKTANPQAGDAWKAVLLANVSALSAIRYLRKYIKTQPVSSEMKSNPPAITYP